MKGLSRPTSRLMHLLILDAFEVPCSFLMYIQNIVNYNTVMFKHNSVHINLKTLIPRNLLPHLVMEISVQSLNFDCKLIKHNNCLCLTMFIQKTSHENI
jgi:hypothetical protein